MRFCFAPALHYGLESLKGFKEIVIAVGAVGFAVGLGRFAVRCLHYSFYSSFTLVVYFISLADSSEFPSVSESGLFFLLLPALR